MEKSGNDDKNSRKYKFYRKPSIKKKGPEIRQTKTSVARMYMANPLLRNEQKIEEPQRNINIKPNQPNTGAIPKTKVNNLAGNGPHLNEPKRNINIKPNRPNTETSSNTKVTSFVFVGNGPGNLSYLKSKKSSLCDPRLSSSDFIFNKNISSSTVIHEENAFEEPKLCVQTKTKKNNTVNKENKLPMRKTLSSRHLENKQKEFNAIVRRGKSSISNGCERKPLRRSKSLEIFKHDDCSTIQEENRTMSGSFEILTNFERIICTYVQTKAPKPIITMNDPCENFDDENKENVDFGIIDSESYEDLLIQPYC